MYPLPSTNQRWLNVIDLMCLQGNEQVLVIVYSIVVTLFTAIKGNMNVYVRDEQYLIQGMWNKINVLKSFTSFCLSRDNISINKNNPYVAYFQVKGFANGYKYLNISIDKSLV